MKATDPMYALKRASRIVKTKYKILHSTIQVEDPESGYEFDCE